MGPWERYQQQAGGGGGTLAERGGQVQGPWGQRAQAQGASRVQQQQEQSGAREAGTANTSLQLLAGLGRARRLIEGDTPTGPMAEDWGPGELDWIPGSMTMARMMPGARGYVGIPSTQELTNLGELEKLSTLAATAVAGQTTTGMDANTRQAVRDALFGAERSQGENRQNVNYLLQQYVNDAIATRVQQAWRSRYGDVNATDPATGMNAMDYIAAVRRQMPNYGPSFEDRRSYNTRVRTRTGASIDLPEVSSYIDSLVSAIRGEMDQPESNAQPRNAPARPNTQTQQPRVGQTRQFPNGRTGRWDGHGWVAQ